MSPAAPDPSGPAPGSPTRVGMISGLAGAILYLLLIATSFVTSGTEPGMQVLTLLVGMVLLTIPMVVIGVALVFFARSRAFAVGLLVAVAFGVLLTSVVCVAVLSTGET